MSETHSSDADDLELRVERSAVHQRSPSDISGEVEELARTGMRVFVERDELMQRGIRRDETCAGVAFVATTELPALLRLYDDVLQC